MWFRGLTPSHLHCCFCCCLMQKETRRVFTSYDSSTTEVCHIQRHLLLVHYSSKASLKLHLLETEFADMQETQKEDLIASHQPYDFSFELRSAEFLVFRFILWRIFKLHIKNEANSIKYHSFKVRFGRFLCQT